MKVHTSLSLLTHYDRKLSIHWHEDLRKGIKKFDNYARNLNEGMRHVNVRLGIGLVDGEHVVDVPEDYRGYSLFATSLVEMLIIMSYGAVINGLSREDLKDILQYGMHGILKDPMKIEKFDHAVDQITYNLIYESMRQGIDSDMLTLFPFVSLAEKHVMAMEGWL